MTDTGFLKRILIFDDDEDQRKLLLNYLGKMFTGVELEQYDPVALGAPAEDFNWSRYDVLILDYYLCLHGVTGLDIVHINRNNPDFPATIMLTGAGNEEIAMRALKAGIYDYLRKQSLDKQELRTSILNAFEKHKQAKKIRGQLTQQGAAFNKALFYQQLEYKKGDEEFRNRVLFLIELNDHAAIEERAGMILRDNIVRHIAKQSYEVFKLGECKPTVIRIGDYSIALLIDAPESRKTLEFNINGLINHLKKRPYKFGENKFRFTISIGVVALPGQGQSADTILNYARSACKIAAEAEDNAYHIYDENEVTAIESSATPAVEPPLAVDVPKPDIPVLIKDPAPAPISNPVAISVGLEDKSAPVTKPVTDNSGIDETDFIQVPVAESKTRDSNPDEAALHIDFEPVLEPVSVPEKPEAKPVSVKPVPSVQKPAVTTIPVTPPAQKKPEAKPVIKADATIQKPVTVSAPVENARPQKTLAELKAEAAKPKPVQPKPVSPAPVTAPAPKKEDPELNVAELDEAGRNLKMAFDEKRVIQLFQPVISLMNEETENNDEIHKASLQLIDKDGTVKTATDIKSHITLPAFRKFVDRWLLREIIGRLTNNSKNQHTFIIDISDASLADANFFNWLRKLLTGLDSINPGRFIVMEVDTKHLSSLEKQANALITYLRKTHNFKFLLGNVDTSAEVVQFTSSIKFDLVRCNHNLIRELQDLVPADKTAGKSQLELIKSTGTRFIADDIGDATALTEAISLSTEYAMGNLIGDPASQLDDVTNIETFEII